MKKQLLIALIATSFFMGGCTYTDYVHVPPKSAQGLSCVNQCEYDKQICNSERQRVDQQLRMRYDRDMDRYNYCVANSNNNSSRCSRPYREYPQGFNCDSIYDACFKTCGGEIIPVEKEL